jgi:hypothetical protein
MPELDIVTQNADLTFPPSVQYNFIFWKHRLENVPNVLDIVAPATILAVEANWHGNGSPMTEKDKNDMTKWCNTMEAVTTGRATDDDLGSINRVIAAGEAAGRGLGSMARLALALQGTGTTIWPIDTFTRPVSQLPPILREDPSLEGAQRLPERMVARESLAVRQLVGLGEIALFKEEEPTIKVLYGARHYLLETATRRLGAQTTRTFIDSYSPDPAQIIEARRRWGVEAASSERLQAEAEAAYAYWGLVAIFPNLHGHPKTLFLLKRLVDMQEQAPDKWGEFQITMYEGIEAKSGADKQSSLRPFKVRQTARKAERAKASLAEMLKFDFSGL